MTRGQQIFHARLWPVLGPLVLVCTIGAVWPLVRKGRATGVASA